MAQISAHVSALRRDLLAAVRANAYGLPDAAAARHSDPEAATMVPVPSQCPCLPFC